MIKTAYIFLGMLFRLTVQIMFSPYKHMFYWEIHLKFKLLLQGSVSPDASSMNGL